MNKQARPLVLALVVCAGAAAAASQAPAGPTTEEIDAIVRAAAQRFAVPGLAVAVVKDGQVVLGRGYGVREAGRSDAVDQHTLFYTASVTKAFTVTGLGILADQGKFRIDDPVVKHLPEFALADRAASDALTVRDLMAHRTGLPRADLLMLSGLSNVDMVRALSKLAPQAPPRTRFTYQNQMYLVLGVVLERLAGMPWSRFIEERVLRPVGFVDGNAGGLGHWQGRPAASPHARRPGGPAALDLVPRDPYGAGGVNASAADLAAWLAFQLGDGSVQGRRIVNANVLAAEHAPNTIVPGNPTMPSAVVSTYGLGWFVHDYFGHKIVQHGGNGEGWTALVWMAPQLRLGVAVLTNMHNSGAPLAIAYSVADRFLGRPARGWLDEYAALEAKMGPPPLPAAPAGLAAPGPASVGTYEHPVFGRASVSERSGGLQFTYGSLSGVIDGTAVSWRRSDMAAVLGPGRIGVRQDGQRTMLLLEAGGERFEFTRVQ